MRPLTDANDWHSPEEVDVQRERIAAALALHQPQTVLGRVICPTCDPECLGEPFPCATVRALNGS